MQALVLAGGQGTRLRPLTESVPKPVLPLAGRPHLAYVVDWLVGHGVDDVVVSCGFMSDAVREALDGITDVPVSFADEPDPRGTAGAIRFAADAGQLGDRFLVLNGDVLCDLDLSGLIAQHEETGARATIALYPVEDPTAYGLVRRKGNEVLEFLEKPDPSEIDTDEINAGAYCLERSVLDLIEPGVAVSIEREVFPRLVGEGLYGRRLEGYWMDIGTPDRFLQASWDILEGRVRTPVGERVTDGLLVEEGAEVHPGAEVRAPAMIEAGSTVAEGAAIGPKAVLGPGCEVGAGASVTGSVLLAGCSVGESASVHGAILSAGAGVEAGSRLEDGAVVAAGETVGA